MDFDDKLTGKIIEVFDNHQEKYNPENWKKLKKRLTQRKKKIIFGYPFLSEAATISILFGLGFYFTFIFNTTTNYIGNSLATISEIKISKESVFQNQNKTKEEKIQIIIDNYNTKIQPNTLINCKNDTSENKINRNIPDSIKTKKTEKNKNEIITTTICKTDSILTSNKNTIENNIQDDLIKNRKNEHVKIAFAIATMYNYGMQNINSKMNFGGGFSAEIPINKLISINSGIIVAKQNFQFDWNKNNAKSASSAIVSMKAHSTEETNIFVKKADLVSVEIPLNVQFNIHLAKNKSIQIISGLSSLVYLQEKYTLIYHELVNERTYNSISDTYSYSVSSVEKQTDEHQPMLKRYDLGKLFNLSVGYKIPFKKGFIITEPYIKIPFGSLTSEELKMGYGGLTIRYSFN